MNKQTVIEERTNPPIIATGKWVYWLVGFALFLIAMAFLTAPSDIKEDIGFVLLIFLGGAVGLALLGGTIVLIIFLVFYFRGTRANVRAKERDADYIAPNENGDFGLVFNKDTGEWENYNIKAILQMLEQTNDDETKLALTPEQMFQIFSVWRMTSGKFGTPPASTIKTLENQKTLASGDKQEREYPYVTNPQESPVLMAVAQEDIGND